jgi:hypothetical protein
MVLTDEDTLRLNVLLANDIQAMRIDETKMRVYGLTQQGEAKIQLHPNCRDEHYLRQVRELISTQVLGSPGSYPIYLKRWHRMGQAKENSLEQLLMLGEPEAVAAVVNAPGLTPELARRAWWAMPEAEHARSMLKHPAIVQNSLGVMLANYLVDYLPFEAEIAPLIESVRLVLQPGLIDEETRLQIWQKGQHKTAYLVGFLWTVPDDLPEPLPARSDATVLLTQLTPLLQQDNQVAKYVLRVTDSCGQTFINTCVQVLRKPANQEVVNALFDILADYFIAMRPLHYDEEMNMITLLERAQATCETCQDRLSIEKRAVLAAAPTLPTTLRAMSVLSGLSYAVLRPIFSKTTAIGSLMRKKLTPVTAPILEQLNSLMSA